MHIYIVSVGVGFFFLASHGRPTGPVLTGGADMNSLKAPKLPQCASKLFQNGGVWPKARKQPSIFLDLTQGEQNKGLRLP